MQTKSAELQVCFSVSSFSSLVSAVENLYWRNLKRHLLSSDSSQNNRPEQSHNPFSVVMHVNDDRVKMEMKSMKEMMHYITTFVC